MSSESSISFTSVTSLLLRCFIPYAFSSFSRYICHWICSPSNFPWNILSETRLHVSSIHRRYISCWEGEVIKITYVVGIASGLRSSWWQGRSAIILRMRRRWGSTTKMKDFWTKFFPIEPVTCCSQTVTQIVRIGFQLELSLHHRWGKCIEYL